METKINIFEYATRKKLRFNFNGNLSTEELWGLHTNSLNEIYKELSAEKKKLTNGEDSLISEVTNSKEVETINIKMQIVKHIFDTKQEELTERVASAEKAQRKRYLEELIAKKTSEADNNKTLEELQKELAEL